MKFLTAFFICISAVYCFLAPQQRSIDVPSNYSIQELPVQTKTTGTAFDFKGYQITPLADFDIKGRILNYKEYSSDKESELSPVDLALGWGPMSKNAVISEIDISQRNRWYFWRTNKFPIPRKDIESNSANMHIIPANDLIANKLASIKRGQVASIKGYLVECTQNGWKWKSSLTRNDTGSGACEVIFVNNLTVSNP